MGDSDASSVDEITGLNELQLKGDCHGLYLVVADRHPDPPPNYLSALASLAVELRARFSSATLADPAIRGGNDEIGFGHSSHAFSRAGRHARLGQRVPQ